MNSDNRNCFRKVALVSILPGVIFLLILKLFTLAWSIRYT